MNRRRLGTSDLEVSEIALGSWLTYAGGVERERAEACTHAAFEAGINFFDTANVYGQGAAERAWGEILGDYPREEYVLATKLYFPVEGGSGLSAEQVHRQIDASLARLQTDYVDLYQCHRFDVDTPIEETNVTPSTAASRPASICSGVHSLKPIQRALPALTTSASASIVSSIGVSTSKRWHW